MKTQTLRPAVLLAALVLGTAAACFPFDSHAGHTTGVAAFFPRASLPDDCDAVVLERLGASLSGPGSAEIELATAGRDTWWKGLELFVTNRFRASARAEGHGARAPGRLVVFPHELEEAQLVFVKPKFLGAATRVYQINGLSAFTNQRVRFVWERDRC